MLSALLQYILKMKIASAFEEFIVHDIQTLINILEKKVTLLSLLMKGNVEGEVDWEECLAAM